MVGPISTRIFFKCMTDVQCCMLDCCEAAESPEQPLPLPPAVVSWRSEGSLVTVVSRYARAEVVADITGR